jgi:hypothetical protein
MPTPSIAVRSGNSAEETYRGDTGEVNCRRPGQDDDGREARTLVPERQRVTRRAERDEIPRNSKAASARRQDLANLDGVDVRAALLAPAVGARDDLEPHSQVEDTGPDEPDQDEKQGVQHGDPPPKRRVVPAV